MTRPCSFQKKMAVVLIVFCGIVCFSSLWLSSQLQLSTKVQQQEDRRRPQNPQLEALHQSKESLQQRHKPEGSKPQQMMAQSEEVTRKEVPTTSIEQSRLPASQIYTCTWQNNTVTVPVKTPSFILIGVQKSGSTSILSYCRDHPQVMQTVKNARREAHFFDSNIAPLLGKARKMKLSKEEKGCFYLDNYMNLFDTNAILHNRTSPAQPWLYAFEKTPSYFTTGGVPERIQQTVPWSKLVLILRNPVDRAYSQYKMTIRNIHELRELSIEDFLLQEVSQMRKWKMTTFRLLNETRTERSSTSSHAIDQSHWTKAIDAREDSLDSHMLLRKGMYSESLTAWLKLFSVGTDMMVINHRDLERDTEGVYRKILQFAGIPDDPYIGSNREFKRVRRDKRADDRPLSNATRDYLKEFFVPYNAKLEALLGEQWSVDNLGWT